MDWKEFIASIIESLAWPAIIFYAIYVLKDRLAELLPKLKKFKHKDTELEFAQAVVELQKEVAQIEAKSPEAKLPNKEIEDKNQYLIELSQISPRSAVIEAWRLVEYAATDLLNKSYPELMGHEKATYHDMQRFLKSENFSHLERHYFNELRKLRNMAAHSEEFELKGMPVETYINLALSMARKISEQKH